MDEPTFNTPTASLGGKPSTGTSPSPISSSEQSSSLFAALGRLIWTIIQVTPAVLLWIITFVTISLPTWLFTIGTTSLTITMNFTQIVIVFLTLASVVSWLVRYRLLNVYTRLPAEPERKEPQIDIFPDSQAGDSKPGLSNYLDEFLSAIKVFGYLERPVFHELTRTMQTRKLMAGEIMQLEQEQGYSLVVDGQVQIFVESAKQKAKYREDEYSSDESLDDGDGRGFQLLTDVSNGAPISSLFSILSLFTEDVKLRHEDDETPPEIIPKLSDHPVMQAENGRAASVRRPLHYSRAKHGTDSQRGGEQAAGSTSDSPGFPPLSLDSSQELRIGRVRPVSRDGGYLEDAPRMFESDRKFSKSAHPDIIARAVVDTTIAIIPATAFKRLTRVYPRATAHIVQVIVSRLQRVTLATAFDYLGLMHDVIKTENRMNRLTAYELPNFLRGTALERLKEKFRHELDTLDSIDLAMGIALHNRRRHSRRVAASSARGGKPSDIPASIEEEVVLSRVNTRNSDELQSPERSRVAAGDLLVSTPSSRSSRGMSTSARDPSRGSWSNFSSTNLGAPTPLAERSFNPFSVPSVQERMSLHRQDSIDEDNLFRQSILECMFKAVGLTETKDLIRATESVEASPRIFSYDARRQKAMLSNAFGFLGHDDRLRDADAESMTASVSSMNAPVNISALRAEMIDEVEIVYFPKNSVLVEQGERNPGLYYVIDGFLEVNGPQKSSRSQSSGGAKEMKGGSKGGDSFDSGAGARRQSSAYGLSDTAEPSSDRLFLIRPGGIAGYIGTISSYRSFTNVKARMDVYVGFLPRKSIEKLVEKYPIILLTLAKRLTELLPKLILHLDFALEWVQINAGQVLHHQGDESDSIYIVLNGRLRAITNGEKGKMTVVGEYGQGESVGELEVMTESDRPADLHAIRDSELVKFPKTLFQSLSLEHPGITMQLSKIIASRMRALVEDPMRDQGLDRTHKSGSQIVSSTNNLRTVAVLPVTAGVPVSEFSTRLSNALTEVGIPSGVALLNQSAILNHLGRHAFSRMGKLKLAQYLADLEEKYGMVLYVADTSVNAPWTQTCIAQADCVLLVALAETSPSIGEYERFLLGMKSTARKELILLHVDRYCTPGLTKEWLRNRVWINGGHHHIQMDLRGTPSEHSSSNTRHGFLATRGRLAYTSLRNRVQLLQAEIQKFTSIRQRFARTPLYTTDESTLRGDFHRLARRLLGRSIGLVLGGGGARGIAQIGVIRALEEAGVPIDIIGGTSIGAFIGALYARDADIVPMYGRAKKFAGRMGSLWRFVLDLTYPTAAYTTGHEFNRGIFKTFGDSRIEDFWLEFYCNTTNISRSRSEIHTSGYAWRYVRASMSLAGLLPPLCDERGDMLLDGGYVDNLSVSHMMGLNHCSLIFAVDVGSLDDGIPQRYGDSLSGFWAIFNRWNPFSSTPNPPTLSEIQGRLAYVSSVDRLEAAKLAKGVVYMRPPIDPFATLDFGRFEEIYKVGYAYGQEFLEGMRKEGRWPLGGQGGAGSQGEKGDGVGGSGTVGKEERNMRRTVAPRRASI